MPHPQSDPSTGSEMLEFNSKVVIAKSTTVFGTGMSHTIVDTLNASGKITSTSVEYSTKKEVPDPESEWDRIRIGCALNVDADGVVTQSSINRNTGEEYILPEWDDFLVAIGIDKTTLPLTTTMRPVDLKEENIDFIDSADARLAGTPNSLDGVDGLPIIGYNVISKIASKSIGAVQYRVDVIDNDLEISDYTGDRLFYSAKVDPEVLDLLLPGGVYDMFTNLATDSIGNTWDLVYDFEEPIIPVSGVTTIGEFDAKVKTTSLSTLGKVMDTELTYSGVNATSFSDVTYSILLGTGVDEKLATLSFSNQYQTPLSAKCKLVSTGLSAQSDEWDQFLAEMDLITLKDESAIIYTKFDTYRVQLSYAASLTSIINELLGIGDDNFPAVHLTGIVVSLVGDGTSTISVQKTDYFNSKLFVSKVDGIISVREFTCSGSYKNLKIDPATLNSLFPGGTYDDVTDTVTDSSGNVWTLTGVYTRTMQMFDSLIQEKAAEELGRELKVQLDGTTDGAVFSPTAIEYSDLVTSAVEGDAFGVLSIRFPTSVKQRCVLGGTYASPYGERCVSDEWSTFLTSIEMSALIGSDTSVSLPLTISTLGTGYTSEIESMNAYLSTTFGLQTEGRFEYYFAAPERNSASIEFHPSYDDMLGVELEGEVVTRRRFYSSSETYKDIRNNAVTREIVFPGSTYDSVTDKVVDANGDSWALEGTVDKYVA